MRVTATFSDGLHRQLNGRAVGDEFTIKEAAENLNIGIPFDDEAERTREELRHTITTLREHLEEK